MQNRISALLYNTDSDSRREAAVGLAESNVPEVITALAQALADSNKGVRDAANRSLVTIGGSDVARAIVPYIAHEDIMLRNLAAELLYRLGKDAICSLEPFLRNADQDVRKMAVDILGLLRHRDAATAIIPLLYDSDANVVMSTVEALGSIGDESAISHLIQVYEQDPYARPTVAEALGKIGGRAASEFLCKSFQTAIASANVDQLALFGIIEALGLIGDPGAFSLLSNHLPQVSGKLRRMMLSAIVWIADKCGMPLEIPGATSADLISLLDDSDLRVRLNAVKALSGISDSEVTKAFIDSLGISEYFDVVLFGLLEWRDDAFPLIMEKLEADGSKHKKELILLLRTLVKQKVESNGLAIEEALIGRAFTLVEQQWESAEEETRSAIVETLFVLHGDRTLVMLDTLMNDPDPWLRMRVIELLGTLDEERLPEFVSRYLTDEDEMVRTTAEWVLQSKGYSFEPNQSV